MTTSSRENTSSTDLGRINSLARRYLTGRDPLGLDEVAEALELCLNGEEERRVIWWWNEGIRDYAESEDHIAELNQLLLNRRAELYPKN